VDSAFTQKGLEQSPLSRPPMPSPESTLAARRNQIRLAPDEEDQIALIEAKVRARVKECRVPVKDKLQDFDRQRQGHVTFDQFARSLQMINLPINMDEITLLAKKYCDRGNTRDVNYMEFCSTCDPPDPAMVLAQEQNASPYMDTAVSQYFNKHGEVIPVS